MKITSISASWPISNTYFVLLLTVATIAAEKQPQRKDLYGDPLPPGAVARMGTVRWRLPGLVTACAYSRDGKTLVAGSGAAIYLFDATNGRLLRKLRHHKADVTCLSFSPDGKTLASGSKDGTICLSEWPSGKARYQFAAHEDGVKSLAFAGTGKFLASGGEDQRIRLWDAATGRQLRQFQKLEGAVWAVAVSPDGRIVASSQYGDDPVRLWDSTSGRLLHVYKSEGDWIPSLSFSPNGKLLAFPTGLVDITVLDVATGKIVRLLHSRHVDFINAVAFSHDGGALAVATGGCNLALWDAATGKIVHQLPSNHDARQSGGIMCMAFSPDGRRLAFGQDHCLRVWDVREWREILPKAGHTDSVYRVLFSRDDKTLATATDEPVDALREWDAATGKQLRTLYRQHLLGRHGFHLSPDFRILTTAETDEERLLLHSRNTTSEKETHRLTLPFNFHFGHYPYAIVFSPNGKIITGQSSEEHQHPQPILLHNTISGKKIGQLPGTHTWLRFSPDSEILGCFQSEQIKLYDVSSCRLIRGLSLDKRVDSILNVAFSPDSRLMATTSTNIVESANRNQLDLWEATTGQKRVSLTIPRTPFTLAFSPDGTLLATGDTNGTIHLRSMGNCKEIRQLRGHHGAAIESLAFSHDGKRLASGSWDTTALIWDVRDAAKAARPHRTEASREQLQRLWADLAGNDGDRVNRAIWNLVAARQSVSWLQDHLKPIPHADAARISRLIADLDSDTFAVREKAARELRQIAETAEPALRKALTDKPSLELRRRVEPLLKDLQRRSGSSASALRAWRALEVLEHLGTPEARQLLQRLANGASEARLTIAAKASLRRLAARSLSIPR